MKPLASLAVASVLVLLAALGCGGAGPSAFSGGQGTLAVHLADAPDPTITAVTIELDRVEAHIGSQWQVVAGTPASINLLELVEDDLLVALGSVPAGAYTQVRLVVSSATVTDSEGTHPLIIPSGSQTGIKVNLNFDVDPNVLTEVLLDFNVQKSVVKQGNGVYRLQPVIPAVVKVLSGTVSGSVTDGANPLGNATITATYTAGSAYPLGTVVNETSSLVDGNFKVWALKAGTYTVDFQWTDPENPGTVLSKSVPGVEVVAQQNVDLGSVLLE